MTFVAEFDATEFVVAVIEYVPVTTPVAVTVCFIVTVGAEDKNMESYGEVAPKLA